MKALPKLLILSAIMALAGCGKNNESGKSGGRYSSSYCVSYNANGQCAQYQSYTVNNVNSPYSYNGVNLNTVQMENPCILSQSYGQTTVARTTVSVRVNIGTVVANNDMYVGVTTYGDVAAIIGNGTNQPLFVAYVCPRPVSGQGSLSPVITIGAYTNCRAKPITAANMYFPDGSQANFRDPKFGSSQQRPFTFCQ